MPWTMMTMAMTRTPQGSRWYLPKPNIIVFLIKPVIILFEAETGDREAQKQAQAYFGPPGIIDNSYILSTIGSGFQKAHFSHTSTDRINQKQDQICGVATAKYR